MWIRPKEEDVRARHDEALALLDRGDLEGATRIAIELRQIGWSGAFEILALVARAQHDVQGAVLVLDEGCKLAPDAWSLHELHGTLLDALGRGEDAIAAYDRALACENVWTPSVRYNRSIARWRSGDAGGALADAEAVLSGATPPPFAIDAMRVAVDALDKLGRQDDAVSLIRTAMSEAQNDDEVTTRLRALRALALSRAGDVEGARQDARAAIEAGHGNAALAQIMPALRHDDRPARWLRLVVQGRTRAGDRDHGFLRVVSVLAADENEALQWAAEMEPVSGREQLAVDECKENDAPRPSGGIARGVVGASGRILFDET